MWCGVNQDFTKFIKKVSYEAAAGNDGIMISLLVNTDKERITIMVNCTPCLSNCPIIMIRIIGLRLQRSMGGQKRYWKRRSHFPFVSPPAPGLNWNVDLGFLKKNSSRLGQRNIGPMTGSRMGNGNLSIGVQGCDGRGNSPS